jgi:hypothetical protein
MVEQLRELLSTGSNTLSIDVRVSRQHGLNIGRVARAMRDCFHNHEIVSSSLAVTSRSVVASIFAKCSSARIESSTDIQDTEVLILTVLEGHRLLRADRLDEE